MGILEADASVFVSYPVGSRGCNIGRGDEGGGVVGEEAADIMLAAERGFLESFLRQASLQYSRELEGVVICFSHMALRKVVSPVGRLDPEQISEGLPVLQETCSHGLVRVACL